MRPDPVGPEGLLDDLAILCEQLVQLQLSEGSSEMVNVEDTGGRVAGRGRGAAHHWRRGEEEE